MLSKYLSNVLFRYLTSCRKDIEIVKNRWFEPGLTKKNAKIVYKATKKGLKLSNLYFLNGFDYFS